MKQEEEVPDNKVEGNKKFCAFMPGYTAWDIKDEKGNMICYQVMDDWVYSTCDKLCYAKKDSVITCPSTCKPPYYKDSSGTCYKLLPSDKKPGKDVKFENTKCIVKGKPELYYDVKLQQCLEKKPSWYYCEQDQKCYEKKTACTGPCA